MNRKNKRAKRHVHFIPVWTFNQVQRALPYVASIMRSLREHHLAALAQNRNARRLDALPGRPDRHTLIEREDAVRDAREADECFQEALEELHTLDIYCLDPARGEALIPFAHEQQLAWFVFDLFQPSYISSWRFHTDPLDTRHPLTDAQKGLAAVEK
jgi:hypothetical protein